MEEELPRLLERELVPFQAAVQAEVGTIMSAHVVFPVLDEEWPATLSERVIPELLRRRLAFDGVVLSDDMEMKAVHGRWDTHTLVRRATLATVDVRAESATCPRSESHCWARIEYQLQQSWAITSSTSPPSSP